MWVLNGTVDPPSSSVVEVTAHRKQGEMAKKKTAKKKPTKRKASTKRSSTRNATKEPEALDPDLPWQVYDPVDLSLIAAQLHQREADPLVAINDAYRLLENAHTFNAELNRKNKAQQIALQCCEYGKSGRELYVVNKMALCCVRVAKGGVGNSNDSMVLLRSWLRELWRMENWTESQCASRKGPEPTPDEVQAFREEEYSMRGSPLAVPDLVTARQLVESFLGWIEAQERIRNPMSLTNGSKRNRSPRDSESRRFVSPKDRGATRGPQGFTRKQR